VSSKQLLKRIGLGILTLWLVSLVVFAAVIALPGDAATAILGKEATPARVAALREQLHLNDSLVTQYTQWLKGILTFDFGDSAATQQPVTQLLSGEKAWEDPQVVVLPAATLIIAVVPYVSRIMRGSMIEVLESEYVTMARLKGLPERQVIWRHAVPNAIVPAIQVTALELAWMAGGIVIVEFVFQYPGIGASLVDAVGNRDMPVVQTVTMLAAAVYVFLNLAADLATILVTPRLRTAGR
jgi:peptide/nickel transport system permease protein